MQCPESIPSDPYTERLAEKNHTARTRTGSSDLNEIVPELVSKPPAPINRQFDGKILRFYAIHEDDEARRFIILVSTLPMEHGNDHRSSQIYPIDNTIEVREVHRANDGYDPLSAYLHRQRVPKDSQYHISKLHIDRGCEPSR